MHLNPTRDIQDRRPFDSSVDVGCFVFCCRRLALTWLVLGTMLYGVSSSWSQRNGLRGCLGAYLIPADAKGACLGCCWLGGG